MDDELGIRAGRESLQQSRLSLLHRRRAQARLAALAILSSHLVEALRSIYGLRGAVEPHSFRRPPRCQSSRALSVEQHLGQLRPAKRTDIGNVLEFDFNYLTDTPLRLHYDFDYVDEDMLAEAQIENGKNQNSRRRVFDLHLAAGQAYQKIDVRSSAKIREKRRPCDCTHCRPLSFWRRKKSRGQRSPESTWRESGETAGGFPK